MQYAQTEPTRAEIDALGGPTVVEFGSPDCGICRAAEPYIAAAFADHPAVRRFRVADGSGRPLGRSYRVKLWPTLIFLRDGKEVGRVVRPATAELVRQELAHIDTAAH
ncbi:MAG: thioredoxin family protein [Burkholderiaceae bacterium]|nr:thioredoxin family protein [Burkholderiaceae bacterium]